MIKRSIGLEPVSLMDINKNHNGCLLFFLIVIAILLSSCGFTPEVGFTPTGIPLKISVNTRGEITFAVEGEVKIPALLGTVTVGAAYDSPNSDDVENTLTIRINACERIYDLHGEDFTIDFEPGAYRRISVSKTGKDLFLILEGPGYDGCEAPSTFAVVQTATTGDNTRVWSGPNIYQGYIITLLSKGSLVVIVDGPVQGPIRYDNNIKGNWYQVQLPSDSAPLGWVVEESVTFK